MRSVCVFLLTLLAPGLSAAPDRKAEAAALYKKAEKADDVRALEILARARTLDPDNAEIPYRMGFLYHKMNRTQDAEKYYTAAIERNACHERALNNLGSIYAAKSETDRAAEEYRRALKCAPRSVSALYNLANLVTDDKEAESLYTRALAIDPRHARSQHNLGVLYMNRGGEENLKRAELHLERARLLSPSDPLVLYNAALVKKHLGRTAQAVTLLDSADRLCETRPQLRRKIRAEKAGLQTR